MGEEKEGEVTGEQGAEDEEKEGLEEGAPLILLMK